MDATLKRWPDGAEAATGNAQLIMSEKARFLHHLTKDATCILVALCEATAVMVTDIR